MVANNDYRISDIILKRFEFHNFYTKNSTKLYNGSLLNFDKFAKKFVVHVV